jgi:ADP-ribose pyrophosphatase YjhB (NUDIX family)
MVEIVGESGCMSDLGSSVFPFVDAGENIWGYDGVWAIPTRLPRVIGDEVADLSAHYGAPLQRSFDVQADDYIHAFRFNKSSDRRAEVVFAIEDDAGQLWVHTKAHYPPDIFRLPTGGIHWDELVVDGLLREVQEETGLPVEIKRFLGIIEYQFWYRGMMAPFASYIFHLHSTCIDCPSIQQGEPISEFRAVLPQQLQQLAGNLRNLAGVRRAWGEWRALAHDLVYDALLG